MAITRRAPHVCPAGFQCEYYTNQWVCDNPTNENMITFIMPCNEGVPRNLPVPFFEGLENIPSPITTVEGEEKIAVCFYYGDGSHYSVILDGVNKHFETAIHGVVMLTIKVLNEGHHIQVQFDNAKYCWFPNLKAESGKYILNKTQEFVNLGITEM